MILYLVDAFRHDICMYKFFTCYVQVGGIGDMDRGYLATDVIKQQDNNIRCLNTLNQSELDRFMV